MGVLIMRTTKPDGVSYVSWRGADYPIAIPLAERVVEGITTEILDYLPEFSEGFSHRCQQWRQHLVGITPW